MDLSRKLPKASLWAEEIFASYETRRWEIEGRKIIPILASIFTYLSKNCSKIYELTCTSYMPLNSLTKVMGKLYSSKLEEREKRKIEEIMRLELGDLENSSNFRRYLERPPPIIPKYHLLEKIL